MKNITKLSIWPKLQAIGFVPVRFYAFGKVQAIGCMLGDITIEPHNFSDGKNYHLTGTIKNPFQVELSRYNSMGRLEKFFCRKESMNDFISAREILKEVEKML